MLGACWEGLATGGRRVPCRMRAHARPIHTHAPAHAHAHAHTACTCTCSMHMHIVYTYFYCSVCTSPGSTHLTHAPNMPHPICTIIMCALRRHAGVRGLASCIALSLKFAICLLQLKIRFPLRKICRVIRLSYAGACGANTYTIGVCDSSGLSRRSPCEVLWS